MRPIELPELGSSCSWTAPDTRRSPDALRGLVIRLHDRLEAHDRDEVTEFIDANELGLALEHMTDALSENAQPVAADERADMLDLVALMQMDGHVAKALAFCPAKGDSGRA
jgi:hypothetical protein